MLGIYCRTSRETDIENSTISQQRLSGIKFAEENNFEYELYEDEGKSGYKISDDELDPLNNRPSFTRLINDIKDKKIDKVWVWEHSRLSRNQYASAFIFKIFEKYNIILYENKKQFDMNDPQIKFTRQILDAVSEYERQLIVSRTTRGLRKRIDEGKRSHQKLYCYQKDGKDEKGYVKWIPVESEIENYKHILKRFNEGVSLRRITFEVYDKHRMERWGLPSYAHFLGRILRGYQYTGYQLTIEGSEIFKKFRNNEIDNIQILLDRKYWVKSIPYPLELISIEDWVKICEILQIRGSNLNSVRKDRLLRASKSIATGIIECGDCKQRFYYKEQKITRKKDSHKSIYITYFHHQFFNHSICNQKPKSFNIEYINEIFKIFYFYAKLIFDNKNELIKESQRNIKQNQLKLRDRIKKVEREIIAIEKRIAKFQKALDTTDEIDVIKLLAKQITENEGKTKELDTELSQLKIELEIQNDKYNQTELEMTYYDVKEQINNWFNKLNTEEQRNELISMIKTCKIYSHYLIIDTGKTVFLFDINNHYIFDMKNLENLDKDKIYKDHFIAGKYDDEAKGFNIRNYGTKIIDIKLNREEIRVKTFTYLHEKFNILYDISGLTNLVSFVNHRLLLNIEIKSKEVDWRSQEFLDKYVDIVNQMQEEEE